MGVGRTGPSGESGKKKLKGLELKYLRNQHASCYGIMLGCKVLGGIAWDWKDLVCYSYVCMHACSCLQTTPQSKQQVKNRTPGNKSLCNATLRRVPQTGRLMFNYLPAECPSPWSYNKSSPDPFSYCSVVLFNPDHKETRRPTKRCKQSGFLMTGVV